MKKKSIIISLIVVILLLVLVYFLNSYKTVTFDYNNGSKLVKVRVKKNDVVDEPTKPVKDGYEFLSWMLDDEEYDFNSPVTKNITLIANYTMVSEVSYTIKFDSNGGSDVNDMVVVNGKITTLPTTTKDGYTFAGWYIGSKKIEVGYVLEKDETLVAKWFDNNKCTITFDSNGGTLVNQINLIENSIATMPTNPTRTGYKFLGWYLNGTKYLFNTAVTSNITLVAKWEKESTISYTIKDISGSIVGETMIYLTKDGVNVSGVADLVVITSSGNKTYTVSIPTTGYRTNKNIIVEVKNIKID